MSITDKDGKVWGLVPLAGDEADPPPFEPSAESVLAMRDLAYAYCHNRDGDLDDEPGEDGCQMADQCSCKKDARAILLSIGSQ